MTPWGDMLRHLIARQDTTAVEVAKRAGIDRGWLSNIMRGAPQSRGAAEARPSWEHAEKLADALHLDGDERQRFLDLAAITHLPPAARPRFLALLESPAARRVAEPGSGYLNRPPTPASAPTRSDSEPSREQILAEAEEAAAEIDAARRGNPRRRTGA